MEYVTAYIHPLKWAEGNVFGMSFELEGKIPQCALTGATAEAILSPAKKYRPRTDTQRMKSNHLWLQQRLPRGL